MKIKMLKMAAVMIALAAAFTLAALAVEFPHPTELEGLNAADVAWVSIAAGLVMLMTPALGFFYGGLV
ncbi:MAG: ammonia channel protein, partial [Armatimonadetes bacterium]|nr:ammonia channel protein [Armatimonadota bacterium]